MASKSNSTECLPCKVISYGTVIGVVIYSCCVFKKAPVSAGILGAIGVNGLVALTYQDLTKPDDKEG